LYDSKSPKFTRRESTTKSELRFLTVRRVAMSSTRKIQKVLKSKPTIEGAGVHLKRAFGFGEVPAFDPFLLLDDFRSSDPQHYIKGFPWHPHRGIETITYVLHGAVEHGDSMGNKGVIGSGDVQWMTAGSGIIHQEMPKGDENRLMGGFQLWANLPASHKMMDPRYRDVKSEQIPEVVLGNGAIIKIICGEVDDQRGPVEDIVIDPEYLDINVPAEAEFIHPTKPGHTVFAYIVEGKGYFCKEKDPFTYEVEGVNYFDIERDPFLSSENLILFGDGDQVMVSTADEPVRFLLISGKPIGEPIAWYGPIVMNSQEELRIAFEEYQNRTFIKETR
jgi:redox-sensitive bicupin YhaK (pirin superfamily)